MTQPVIKDTEIVYFIRLDIYSISIASYNVIFGYNACKMMNLVNRCLIFDLIIVIYDIQVNFYNI